jgi:hypothetical protein
MNYSEFQQSLRETNESLNEALQCAVIILRRAQELPLAQRGYMIDMVKDLISVNGEGLSFEPQMLLSCDKIFPESNLAGDHINR